MFIEDRKHNTIIWMEIFHEYYVYNFSIATLLFVRF